MVESLEEMVAAKKISMYLSYSGGMVRVDLSIEKPAQSYAFLAQISKQVTDLGFEIIHMELDGFTMYKFVTVDEFAVLYKIWSS